MNEDLSWCLPLEAAILACGRGEWDAFPVLVDEFDQPLRAFFRKRGQTEEDARDLTQETWVRVARGLASCRLASATPAGRVAQFRAWLFRIAQRLLLTWVRPYPTRVPSTAVCALSEEVLGTAATDPQDYPEEAVLRAASIQDLYRALATLSVEQQRVLRLFYFEDLSYQAIATVTGGDVNLVKGRLYRARQALARAYTALDQ